MMDNAMMDYGPGGHWLELARWGAPTFRFGGRLTPMVKKLVIANVAVFVLQLMGDPFFIRWFGLTPVLVAHGEIWQIGTYMFLHGGINHIFWNMFILWMFGGDVEQTLGSRRFAYLYLFCGVGAGVCAMVVGWGSVYPLIGASGAVYGVLMAYGVLNPYRPVTLLVFFVFPVTMRARTLVGLVCGVQLLVLLQDKGQGLGNLAHLGGLFFGWLALRWPALLSWAQRAERQQQHTRQVRIVSKTSGERERLQDEVDTILAKISKYGMSGLSEYERRRLYEASERLKNL